MSTTTTRTPATPTFEVFVPYEQKTLNPEIKHRGGRWNPDTRKWILPDNQENRTFARTIHPLPSRDLPPDERIATIAQNAVAQLNALGAGEFVLRYAKTVLGVSITSKN